MEIDYRDFCYFFSGWDTFLVRKAIDEKIRWPPGLIERVNKERWKRGRRRTLHYGFDEQLRQTSLRCQCNQSFHVLHPQNHTGYGTGYQ